MKKTIKIILILLLIFSLTTVAFSEEIENINDTNNSGFVNADKNKLHINKKGENLYSDNVKVGFVKDNIEWLSINYLGKKLKFDKMNGRRREGTWYTYVEKGKYEIKIVIEEEGNKATAHVVNGDGTAYSKELLAIPNVDLEIYIPLVDSIELMNLEIIRDYDLSKYKTSNDYNGNMVNGVNIIKHDGFIYYIDKDVNKLHRMNDDMSNRTKLSEDFVSQFQIIDNKIYYINLNEKDKGIYKMKLDGTKKSCIVKGEISYLNIVDNYLYYCDGYNGGNLYKVNKYGRNKKLIVKDNVIYPNVNGDWIYYINKSDRNTIYRTTTDGKYNFKLNNRFARSLNAVGNKVYFSNYDGTFSMNDDGSYEEKLYNDFSQKILIGENNLFLFTDDKIIKQNMTNKNKDEIYMNNSNEVGIFEDKLLYFLAEYNRNIYIYNPDNTDNIIEQIGEGVHKIEKTAYPLAYYKSNNQLVKYNIETKETEILVNEDFFGLYEIIDEWIYYNDFYRGTCKVKIDGTDKQILTNTNVARVTVDESGIYYLETYYGSIVDFCKLDLDGSNKKVIIDDLEEDLHFSYEIHNDYIYYPQKKGLYRINKDGTNKIKISDKYIRQFIIEDDYIYYRDEGYMYRITLDGKDEEILTKAGNYFYGIYKDELIYIKNNEDDSYLNRYNLINKKTTSTKFGKYTDIIGLDDKYLYITTYNDNNNTRTLYQLNLDTDEMIEVFDTELIYLYAFYKDKIIFVKESNIKWLMEK